MTGRPDVDTLAETIDHALAMHPGWRKAKAALSDLAARARGNTDPQGYPLLVNSTEPRERADAAEADRDKWRRWWERTDDERQRQARRVTELQDALGDLVAWADEVNGTGAETLMSLTLRIARARAALDGDGGGA